MAHLKFHYCLLAFGLLSVVCIPVRADPITFSSRAAFNAAAPGLPVETFESASTPPGGAQACNGPVSSASGGGCFPVGGLLPGVVYNASDPDEPRNLTVLGAGFATVGNASRVLGTGFAHDTLNLTFASANAVGFDVFYGLIPGNVAISVFDTADVLLGTFTVFAPVGGTFFGVISTSGNIGRINIASLNTQPLEQVDNVAFGIAAPVPEPMSLLLLGTGLAAVVVKVRTRRRVSGD